MPGSDAGVCPHQAGRAPSPDGSLREWVAYDGRLTTPPPGTDLAGGFIT